MDVKLRALKRAAEHDPSYWPVYARALERALGGVESFERLETPSYRIISESYIADAQMSDMYDVHAVGALEIQTMGSIETIGYLVDVHWTSAFGDDEWPEIWEGLTQEFRDLLTLVEENGYHFVLLWIL